MPENERIKADCTECCFNPSGLSCRLSDKPLYMMREMLGRASHIIKLLHWDIRNRSYDPVDDLDEAERFLEEAEEWTAE